MGHKILDAGNTSKGHPAPPMRDGTSRGISTLLVSPAILPVLPIAKLPRLWVWALKYIQSILVIEDVFWQRLRRQRVRLLAKKDVRTQA